MSAQIELEARFNPAYAWGKAGLLIGAPGDCSGKIRAMFERCGVGYPDNPVKRVVAKDMAAAKGNWLFPEITYSQAKKLALLWLTWPPKPGKKLRPNGHVGILVVDVENGKSLLAHASSTHGFVIVPIDNKDPNNYMGRYISLVRQVEWKNAVVD